MCKKIYPLVLGLLATTSVAFAVQSRPLPPLLPQPTPPTWTCSLYNIQSGHVVISMRVYPRCNPPAVIDKSWQYTTTLAKEGVRMCSITKVPSQYVVTRVSYISQCSQDSVNYPAYTLSAPKDYLEVCAVSPIPTNYKVISTRKTEACGKHDAKTIVRK